MSILKKSPDLKNPEKAVQGQIGGCKSQLVYIQEIIKKLFDPKISIYQRFILLLGPSGSGKTFFANHIKQLMPDKFIKISISSLARSEVGESEKLLASFFKIARETAPSLIFIEDLELLQDKMAAQLSLEMDQINLYKENILMICEATSFNGISDYVAGKLTKKLLFGHPSPDERRKIALIHLANENGELLYPDELERIVAATEGLHASDIKYECDLLKLKDLQTLGSSLSADSLIKGHHGMADNLP